MNPDFIPWIVLFAPLVAALSITFFTQCDRSISAAISISAVVLGFLLSVVFVSWVGWVPIKPESSLNWMQVGTLNIEFGLRFDPLSLLMTLVVTGVASAIHIYSIGYMHDDRALPRFFACLSLFTFSMLGIVLANNFLMLFIFWELVGVSSYLLIGFWFERPSAADAGKKAFITNRLGDFGFILGILIIWTTLGSLNFRELQHKGTVATLTGLLIFCGAMGKSAQFPLHVWLPDAMEGPTPVSALIHAATMVAAGVYMLCRVMFLMPSGSLTVITWIGGFTALLAALITVQQNDIKRILAYSTLSQLGYMVMGVGLGGTAESMFHLTTHAFFKALLFLGAGSVILASHHEQDIWKMGGLRKKMPVTFWTFLVGTLALAGVPPFSGFYSKDSILARASEVHAYGAFLLGALIAVLTSFYMFRLVLVVFFGPARSDHSSHTRECPNVILWPLRVLALFSIIGGFIGIETVYGTYFETHSAEGPISTMEQVIAPFTHAPLAALFGIVSALAGFAGAYVLYARAAEDPLPRRLGKVSRAMANRFYWDEIYQATVIRIHEQLSYIAAALEHWVVNGCVVFLRGSTDISGRALRLLQTGNLQTYAFLLAIGVALLLFLTLK